MVSSTATAVKRMPASGRTTQPWRNGGGSTTDVVAFPAGSTLDGFVWRVSIATIDGDSEFSHFPGVDRFLVPLTGRLDLSVDGAVRTLDRFDVCAFTGETAVASTGVTTASDDLNLMVRRGCATGSLEIITIDRELVVHSSRGESVLIVALDGSLTADGEPLADRDAVLLGAAPARFDSQLVMRGDGVVAVARITST
ncbi:HutD family protein [Glaciihabitans sp. dw_435]|uniref:HutD/Ves family protein n=1 Tax=Glaciihabitans sp. dw_435 TaxID=2720081 RepID=UPI001BD247E1|nr:HutD family protein [Glaciihabitans sp. dw_435]